MWQWDSHGDGAPGVVLSDDIMVDCMLLVAVPSICRGGSETFKALRSRTKQKWSVLILSVHRLDTSQMLADVSSENSGLGVVPSKRSELSCSSTLHGCHASAQTFLVKAARRRPRTV